MEVIKVIHLSYLIDRGYVMTTVSPGLQLTIESTLLKCYKP